MKDLGQLAEVYGEPIEKVKEKYEQLLASRAAEFPSVGTELHERYAYNATISFLHKKKRGKVRVFEGMILACEGRVRDWDKREYERIRREVDRIGAEEAQKIGILNSRGEPIFGPSAGKRAGKAISNREFFEIEGFVLEKGADGKPIPKGFKMYVENAKLLSTVVLNKPVCFQAEVGRGSTDDVYTFNDVEATFFDYVERPSSPNFAMNTALAMYSTVPVGELLKMVRKEQIKNADGTTAEKILIDRHRVLVKDLILVGVYKNRGDASATLEFAHPDLLKWTIWVFFNAVKNEYEPVRDYTAHVYGSMYKIDEEKKEITLNGFGVWQDAAIRPKIPMGELKPEQVKMTFTL